MSGRRGIVLNDDGRSDRPERLRSPEMPFTYSITNSVGAGFVSFVALKALTGRARQVHPLMAGAAVAFLAYFAIG